MTTANQQWTHRWEQVIAPSYRTPSIVLVSGAGTRVTDANGNEYLDLIAGIAVSSLGHGHPAIVEAVTTQVRTIAHTSNLVANEPSVRLAEQLVGLVDGNAKVFLCNDGATANEAAIKVAKRARTGRTRFVAAERSFHGRTLGALSLTGKASIREPFADGALDVTFVPWGDAEALKQTVDETVAAVILEPILGEAGVIPAPAGYLAAARSACDDADALLILDEVQGGIGRTGRWFAHQHDDITPDIITLAKGLGGGLPIGACLALGDTANALRPGDHGSTFGGNPISCAAALAVLATVRNDGLLDHVTKLGERWMSELSSVDHPLVGCVRGSGLWLAIGFTEPVAAGFEQVAREFGFLVNAVSADAIRIAPPLILSDDDADSFTAALPGILATVAAAAKVTS